MSKYNNLVDSTISLGGYFLSAYFKDYDTVIQIMAQLPYISITEKGVTPRSGTKASFVKVLLEEEGNTEWFAFVTGGNLSKSEAASVIALLKEFGHRQKFAGPDIEKIMGISSVDPIKEEKEEPEFDKKWFFIGLAMLLIAVALMIFANIKISDFGDTLVGLFKTYKKTGMMFLKHADKYSKYLVYTRIKGFSWFGVVIGGLLVIENLLRLNSK